MTPEFRAGENPRPIRLTCCECGGRAEGNYSWADGSGDICNRCDAAMTYADFCASDEYAHVEAYNYHLIRLYRQDDSMQNHPRVRMLAENDGGFLP